MNPAQIAMLVAQLGPSIWQFAQGVKQSKQGKSLAEGLVDPVMPIPESATDALGLARTNASSRLMSGQGNLEGRIDRQVANATSNAISGATSSQDLMGAVTGITDRALGQENEVAFQSARDYQGRQRDLMGALQFMSGLEQQKWTNDVLNKFLRDSSAASALQNAGIHNKYNAFKSGMGALGSFAGNNPDAVNRMFTGGIPDKIGSVGTDNLNIPSSAPAPQLNFSAPNLGGMPVDPRRTEWMDFLNTMSNPSFID